MAFSNKKVMYFSYSDKLSDGLSTYICEGTKD